MTGDEPEGFLGRWSRVKRTRARSVPDQETESDTESAIGPDPSPEPDPALAGASDPVAGPAADAAPATLSEEDLAALPSIEDLVQGSDIRPFLRAGVPRSLRNAAMRKIWMLTPGIRDYKDPAVDYAWDWNTPGGVPGDGVGPTPERAAEMLKSLLAPRQQATAVEPESEGGAAPPEHGDLAADGPADDSESPPSDLVDDTAKAKPQVAAAPAQDQLAPDPDQDPVPRRRHGSALPG